MVLRRRGSRLSFAPTPLPGPERDERRLARLYTELVEEQVPLPVDGPAGPALLAELSYALHPPVHEGRVPTFGAVVATGSPPFGPAAAAGDGADGNGSGGNGFGAPAGIAAASSRLDHRPDVELIGHALEPEMQRLAADGRSTFVWRRPDRPDGLLALARSHEDEADLVALRQRLGEVVVVQRERSGRVRAVTSEGVVIWNTVEWVFKPVATSHLRELTRLLPGVATDVLGSLLDLCVHSLSAAGVGATLVWWLDDDEPTGLDRSTARAACSLTVADRRHHPALLNILSQVDRAVVVRRTGELTEVDVALLTSAESGARVAASGGTRHSSARRFSYDQPRSVVFVVSEDGPVSVFSDGASAARVRVDPCRLGYTTADFGAIEGGETRTCPTCGRALLVDVTAIPGWRGGPEVLACPVCAGPVTVDAYRAAIRGPVKLPADVGDRVAHGPVPDGR